MIFSADTEKAFEKDAILLQDKNTQQTKTRRELTLERGPVRS